LLRMEEVEVATLAGSAVTAIGTAAATAAPRLLIKTIRRDTGLFAGSFRSLIATLLISSGAARKLEGAVRENGWPTHRRNVSSDRLVDADMGRPFDGAKDIDPMISAITRHIAFFVYPGFVLLDLSGPLEAFTRAEEMVPGSYRLTVMAPKGGEVESSTCLKVMTQVPMANAIDTFVVVGDFGLPNRIVSSDTIDFIHTASAGARRTASVCMGAFLLAASGLLDGRRATTHWRYAAKLQAMYPAIRVDGDRIFLNEAGVWTSAGMTAGIDMALALIDEDLGKEVSRAVARMLVVYYRRPGGQMQYSSLLELDSDSDRIRQALSFAREHLTGPLTVRQLADVAHLSVRQFGRAFPAATGTTPAKAIERLRAEAARPRVEDGRETLESIARAAGFVDPERMRQSFIRVFGHPPQAIRRAARASEMAR
jgi:transcriptional regulator GlxA family with amidase domain